MADIIIVFNKKIKKLVEQAKKRLKSLGKRQKFQKPLNTAKKIKYPETDKNFSENGDLNPMLKRKVRKLYLHYYKENHKEKEVNQVNSLTHFPKDEYTVLEYKVNEYGKKKGGAKGKNFPRDKKF